MVLYFVLVWFGVFCLFVFCLFVFKVCIDILRFCNIWKGKMAFKGFLLYLRYSVMSIISENSFALKHLCYSYQLFGCHLMSFAKFA